MKLSLDALRLRAEAVASNDLLATISGGNNNDCHDTPAASTTPPPAAAPAPAPSSGVKFEISAGVSVPVGSPATWTFGGKITF